ncbi:ester cyclase [Streptomyces sp. NBC_00576]|uniref:ester cyclase n=1 Tax=Streptomyces sp. NBC_00576 TaxID=2903665 RepID=UPI002E8241B9|nr:ester cyclase [Streptomyces sp. NBC_00576]WUB76387.1 ester cyclase [Streptomyces sp. NBC_00576]
MSTAGATSNTATLNRLHSAVNSGDPDIISKAIDELVAPDVLFHAPVPMGATGAEALKRVWEVLLRAFPDIHVTVEETVAEGDKVASRNTVTGTHRGEYQGLSPTGRTVAYSEIFIVRFADGRIAEIRGVVDVLAQLRQLGALPA